MEIYEESIFEKWQETQYDWKHDFTNEECKYSKFHCEASYLSQIIFKKILSKAGVGNFVSHEKDPKIVLKDDAQAVEFSFDIMNNPKLKLKGEDKIDIDHYRLGSIAQNKADCKEWESIYRTIGNITLLPNYVSKSRHLQFKHNDFNERWDLLLDFCKREWEQFSCSKLFSFNEYMKSTMQEMYFKEIYEKFPDKLKLNEVSSDDLLNWKNEWDQIIDKKELDKEELDLISFGKAKSSDLPIREIVDKICILIELRGRMILAYLQ